MVWTLFVLGAVISWGMYGPILHKGQVQLGNPLRALLCVGIAYFLIGVLVPVITLSAQGGLNGFNTSGTLSAGLGGALGAVGAVCIIWAFRAGGLPTYVMPLVKPSECVVFNVLTSRLPKSAAMPGSAWRLERVWCCTSNRRRSVRADVRAQRFWKTVTMDDSDLLQSLISLLDENRVRYCVIGGQAVNAYAEPLVSLDLDIAIAAADLERVEALCRKVFTVEQFPHSINLSKPESDLRVQIQTDPRYLSFPEHASQEMSRVSLPVACRGRFREGLGQVDQTRAAATSICRYCLMRDILICVIR
jgi:hypothetical protein